MALAVGAALQPRGGSHWMFRYPETLGVVLAGQFLSAGTPATAVRAVPLRGPDQGGEPYSGGPHELADPLARLRDRGILGMNHRNAECILDLNPRRLYPLVDCKSA